MPDLKMFYVFVWGRPSYRVLVDSFFSPTGLHSSSPGTTGPKGADGPEASTVALQGQ
jgi:hypothetical protein